MAVLRAAWRSIVAWAAALGLQGIRPRGAVPHFATAWVRSPRSSYGLPDREWKAPDPTPRFMEVTIR